MKSQQQRVPRSGAPISSSIPNAQLAPLEEVVDRVNSAVEVTTWEFQCLTSWLLHRGEHRSKENHGCSHLKNVRNQQNMATGSHQEQFRAKREGCSQNPSREEIQRRQPNNERSQEHYCPADRLHSSSLSSSYHNWPNHLGRGEAERDMPKGESEEGNCRRQWNILGFGSLSHMPDFFNNGIHMGEFIPPFTKPVSFNTISHNNILPFKNPGNFEHFGKMKYYREIGSIGINLIA